MTSPRFFRLFFIILNINKLSFLQYPFKYRKTKNLYFYGMFISRKKIGLEAQALLLLAKLVER